MMNKEDYKLEIRWDKDGIPYWHLIRKDVPVFANEEELELVHSVMK